jgi:hypothetical protein
VCCSRKWSSVPDCVAAAAELVVVTAAAVVAAKQIVAPAARIQFNRSLCWPSARTGMGQSCKATISAGASQAARVSAVSPARRRRRQSVTAIAREILPFGRNNSRGQKAGRLRGARALARRCGVGGVELLRKPGLAKWCCWSAARFGSKLVFLCCVRLRAEGEAGKQVVLLGGELSPHTLVREFLASPFVLVSSRMCKCPGGRAGPAWRHLASEAAARGWLAE